MTFPSAGGDYSSGPIVPAWYEPGWTAQHPINYPNPDQELPYSGLPSDQLSLLITAAYSDGDGNPLGGFVTAWPSSAFTITEAGVTYRVPQRLCGTETFGDLDAGLSPWSFSMEGSGRIYIWLGLLSIKLACSDNPNLVTDDGNPLTYFITEHISGGRTYTISTPSTATQLPNGAVDMGSLIVPGSVAPYQFDARNPFGDTGIPDTWPVDAPAPPPNSQTITSESTEYVTVNVSAVFTGTDVVFADIELDNVYFAFMQGAAQPQESDWRTALWVPGPPYLAEILIGPENNGLVLAKGSYQVWFMLVDNPEVPVVQVGTLYIT